MPVTEPLYAPLDSLIVMAKFIVQLVSPWRLFPVIDNVEVPVVSVKPPPMLTRPVVVEIQTL